MTIVQVHTRKARDSKFTKNLNAQDDRGFTSLHRLVMTGNDRRDIGFLQSLLERGADPGIRDYKSLTALDRACSLGRIRMMETLVQWGRGREGVSLLRSHSTVSGRTPLHFANESLKFKHAVPLLLKSGADINAPSKHRGRTVLHETVVRHSPDADENKTADHVKWLVTVCGADLEVVDYHGWTALHYAAFMGHMNLVATLLELGANPSARDAKGRTPLHVTASKVCLPRFDEDITIVLEPTKDDKAKDLGLHACVVDHSPTGTNDSSKTASSSDVSDIVRLLLQHGASAWDVDQSGQLTFFLMAQANELPATFSLVQAAALEGLFGERHQS